ncbi:MAG TPA: hypothetical protein PK874_09355 [Desulfobacteraceae bacterium]|nr:hypothetical protein [Desulfobacteraceae bacterium]
MGPDPLKKRTKKFTVVELMIAIAIIIILVAIAAPYLHMLYH